MMFVELDFRKFVGMTPYFTVAVLTFSAFLAGLILICCCQRIVERLYESEEE